MPNSDKLKPSEPLMRIKLQHQFSSQIKSNRKSEFAESFMLNLDITIPNKGIIGILGHSGSGKTTLLRCIAGLENITDGEICVMGESWFNENTSKPVHLRSLGYVFQEASLFPHLNGFQNLMYAANRSATKNDKPFFDKVIDVLGIKEVISHMPAQMSGGQRQRVAIARALLTKPKILLMDEPLASLDNARKNEVMTYLETVRRDFDIPIVYVSHSLNEISRLADYLLILEKGQLVAAGDLLEVFSRLELPIQFEEDCGVVLSGQVMEIDQKFHLANIKLDACTLWTKDNGEPVGQSVRIRILAKDVSITLDEHKDTSILNRIAAVIEEISDDKDPSMCLIKLSVGKAAIIARITRKSCSQLALVVGMRVCAQVKSVAVVR